MHNQFYYQRIETVKGEDGSPVEKIFTDSFNINTVIRTVQMEDGRTLVLLNDIHERAQNVPEIDPRTNKMKGMKRERNTYQSEIYLTKEDADRLFTLTNVE